MVLKVLRIYCFSSISYTVVAVVLMLCTVPLVIIYLTIGSLSLLSAFL